MSKWTAGLLACVCALCLAFACAAETAPTAVPSPTPSVLDQQAMDALAAVFGQAYPDLDETGQRAALDGFLAEGTAGVLAGEVKDGLYTDPNGFSFEVPEGWTLQSAQIGPVIVLTAPEAVLGVTPSIAVTVVIEPQDHSLMDMTNEDIEALLSPALPGFELISLDSFDLHGTQAREMMCMYGTAEDAMLIQYQLYFTENNRLFIITMTTVAEEASYAQVLDIYDAFVADFTVLTQEATGNG